jgi:hypothetical protein
MTQEFSLSPKISKYAILVIVLIGIMSVLVYLLAAKVTYRLGFPLDDAWIHQTYARNLAYYGEWSFIHGYPSGGSTAPLWTAFLVPGFLIGLSPLVWTYFLGTTILISLAISSEFTVRHLIEEYRSKIPWVGFFIVLEWHLVWAAVSGMETLLSAFLATIVLGALALERRNYLTLGLLIGLSVWVRPDALTLIGPAVLVIFLTGSSWKLRLWSLFHLFIGCGIILSFYFLFNLVISDMPFPNTFYAKQAEYSVLQQVPLFFRYSSILMLPLTGAGIVLLPGVIILAVHGIRNRKWGILAGMIWFVGYLLLYAWRLPVTYQHGRYIIPAMPIFFIWGLAGMLHIVDIPSPSRVRWIMFRVWRISTVTAVISFWILGAKAYATDVAFIESEMVTTARWVSENLPSDSLVAAHDIGALGYFAQVKLIDLAGLISPEVIPFIRDEDKLTRYMDKEKANYLITFPSWYPLLVKNHTIIYSSNGQFGPRMGQDNMAVYSWFVP